MAPYSCRLQVKFAKHPYVELCALQHPFPLPHWVTFKGNKIKSAVWAPRRQQLERWCIWESWGMGNGRGAGGHKWEVYHLKVVTLVAPHHRRLHIPAGNQLLHWKEEW